MFHWICPECGREIAPGVKECPVCEPQVGPAAVASAEHSTGPAPSIAQVPTPEVVAQPEVVLQPETEREPPAETARPEPETFADRLADLAQHLHAEPVPYSPARAVPGATVRSKETKRPPAIIDVTPTQPLLAPPPSVRLLAEPQPPSVARPIPAKDIFQPQRAAPSAPTARFAAVPSAVPAARGPVQLPSRPGRAAAPALASFQDYHQAADDQMRPADCPAKAAASSVALRITLPGPALPRELLSLQAAGLVPIRGIGAVSGTNGYGWIARAAVMAILLTAGLAAAYRVMPNPAPPAPVKSAPSPVAEEPAPVRPANSLARLVEVTGIRFLEVNKKPQIRYLLVNHSNAPLASMAVYVTLRAAHPKAGQPPLAQLTFRSPNLAAFEAKEMASPIERVLGPLELPDWQDLRADVDVQ